MKIKCKKCGFMTSSYDTIDGMCLSCLLDMIEIKDQRIEYLEIENCELLRKIQGRGKLVQRAVRNNAKLHELEKVLDIKERRHIEELATKNKIIADLEADRDAWKNRANSNIAHVSSEQSDIVYKLESELARYKQAPSIPFINGGKCNQDHYACDCMIERMNSLEAENKQLKRTLGHTEAALADWGDTGIDELRLKVADLEAELAKYRWIPVEERLPKKFGRYLVINSAGGYRFSRIGVYHPDIKRFSTRLVSHWMEIPEIHDQKEREE